MSETMIDRVTRAVRVEIDGQNGWSGGIDFGPIARAAIEAMREPTLRMLRQAGGDLSSDRFTGIGMARSAWLDMIDACLTESPYTYHQVEEDKPDNSLLAS